MLDQINSCLSIHQPIGTSHDPITMPLLRMNRNMGVTVKCGARFREFADLAEFHLHFLHPHFRMPPSSSTQQHQYDSYKLSEQCKRHAEISSVARLNFMQTCQVPIKIWTGKAKTSSICLKSCLNGQKNNLIDVGRTRTYAPEGNWFLVNRINHFATTPLMVMNQIKRNIYLCQKCQKCSSGLSNAAY